MKVRWVYHPNVVTIDGWEKVDEAARRMREGGFGSLPVMSGDDLMGIITEHDVVQAVAEGQSGTASVFDYMTEAPKTIRADDDCLVAATQMLAIGCRHLPVVESGKVIGMVSARDLLPLVTVTSGAVRVT